MAVLGLSGCGTGRERTSSTPEPRSAAVPADMLGRAVTEVTGPCREVVQRELAEGIRGEPRCSEARAEAGRRLARRRPRPRFGAVDYRDVDLVRLRLRLNVAHGCRSWPVHDPEALSLTSADVDRHGCRAHPYRGPITISAVGDDERRRVLRLQTNRDGYVDVVFAELDAVLRAQGAGALDRYARVELGRDAWAGTIDLRRLRAFTADWHYRWVRRGRGSPALFAHRHGTHPRSDDARALAIEARIARQERDLAAVEAGRMSPRAFLERHIWSPFRRKVEQMLEIELPTPERP